MRNCWVGHNGQQISNFTTHSFSVVPNHNAVNSGENMQLPANIIFLTVYKAPYVIKMTKNNYFEIYLTFT